MEKSPIDELFFELYGYYPNKSGQAFEMIVSAAFKLLLDKDINYDQRLRGDYSDTVYQLDGIVNDADSKKMIEAKDYTLDDKKVGRGDIQKLQGALSDLPVNTGLFASATDYTKPAIKYAESSSVNPMQKPIELFHIRPSTEQDETGRIKKIVVNMIMHVADYSAAKYNFIWTSDGREELIKNGYQSKQIKITIDKFYDKNGEPLISIYELTKSYPPGTTWEKNFISKGCWVIKEGHVRIDNILYPIKGIEYEIPFRVAEDELVIENDGIPRLYIKNADGSIDKLISDEDLKKVRFNNGRVEI
jgi:hypothetical protein